MVNVSEKNVWIVSQCVLNWLKRKKQLGVFVENRITEMKGDKNIKFHYISTTENPADIANRGISACELQHNRLWWHELDWMVKTREAWPVWKCEEQSEKVRSHTESEFRKGKVLFEAKLMAGEDHSENLTDQLLNVPFDLNLQKILLCDKTLAGDCTSSEICQQIEKEDKSAWSS